MAYTPLVRPMDQQAPAWSYGGEDPNSYRSMLQQMDTSKDRAGLEVDIYNKGMELETSKYETAKSQWESEWEKRSKEYDLKIEEQEREAEFDRRLYSQLTTRIPQLIKSGMWAQI